MASSDGAESSSRELRTKKNGCIREPGDRISTLPDDIIHHILSFIPTVDAVRTSVLAKRWRYLWTQTPYIYLDDDQVPFRDKKDAFVQFVDGVIRMFKAPKVVKFSLSIKEPSNAVCVYDWIQFAVQMNVDELSVELNAIMTVYGPIEMPCCESVRDLRLHLGGRGLILPDTGTFSSLEVLSLSRVGLIDDAVEYTLSEQCPCLKSLNFSDCTGLGYLKVCCPLLENIEIIRCDGLYELSILAEKLKTLSMHDSFTYDETHSVKISAPNLQIFNWLDYIVGKFDFGNFTSLKAACVSLVVCPLPQSKSLYLQSAAKFLSSLACAQNLAVEITCFWGLSTNWELLNGLPGLRHNLKHMKLSVGFVKTRRRRSSPPPPPVQGRRSSLLLHILSLQFLFSLSLYLSFHFPLKFKNKETQPPNKTKRKMLSLRSKGMRSIDPMLAAIAEVEGLLNYEFRDPSLLEEALTHSSDTEHHNYQRLEFVGDAAIGLAFSNYFYLTNRDLGPGPLTMLRAANVSTEKLARVAVRHRLYRLLRRNSPALDEIVEEFTLSVGREMEEEKYGMPYGGSTIKAPKVLADIVESIAAAVYVDSNFNLVTLWMVIRGLLEPIITADNLDEQPVTILYEYCQKKGKSINFKNRKSGHTNITEVFMDGQMLGVGSSENQIISKLNAARDALQKLGSCVQDDVEMLDCQNGGGVEVNNAVQRLNEMCTKQRWTQPVYRIDEQKGPAHEKKFICSVRVVISNTEYTKVGDLKSKLRESKNSAAAKMLYEINNW